jgi:hypothetical protein
MAAVQAHENSLIEKPTQQGRTSSCSLCGSSVVGAAPAAALRAMPMEAQVVCEEAATGSSSASGGGDGGCAGGVTNVSGTQQGVPSEQQGLPSAPQGVPAGSSGEPSGKLPVQLKDTWRSRALCVASSPTTQPTISSNSPHLFHLARAHTLHHPPHLFSALLPHFRCFKAGEGVLEMPSVIEAVVGALAGGAAVAGRLSANLLVTACWHGADTAFHHVPGQADEMPALCTITRGREDDTRCRGDDTRCFYDDLLSVGRVSARGGAGKSEVSTEVQRAFDSWETALGKKI